MQVAKTWLCNPARNRNTNQRCVTTSAAASQEQPFTTIDVPSAIFTNANDINPRGEIVGGYRSADGRMHGYLLSRGAFTTIDFPGATLTAATA